MSKADEVRERASRARQEATMRARRAAEDEYSRIITQCIEMEADVGHFECDVEPSKNAYNEEMYISRIIELAQDDGFDATYERRPLYRRAFARISWAPKSE